MPPNCLPPRSPLGSQNDGSLPETELHPTASAASAINRKNRCLCGENKCLHGGLTGQPTVEHSLLNYRLRIKPMSIEKIYRRKTRGFSFSRSARPDARVAPPRLLLAVAIAAVVGQLGCSNVAAYQRGKLAHFTMRPGDASSAAQAHIYAIQEGAIGGTVGATTGCGCN
jgi:Domain of unknown function (DUF4266)